MPTVSSPLLSIPEKEELYQQITDYSHETTIIHSNQKVLYINQSGADFFKASKAAVVGANVVDVFTEDYKELITERIRKGMEDRTIGELMDTTVKRFDGTRADVELYCYPVQYGNTTAIQSILHDVTAKKKTERDLLQLKNEVSTPIVPIIDGLAVLPLVGSVDGDRSMRLLDIIPQKIQGENLHCLIIDVSGIYNIDNVVAEFLYKIDQIMRLLGIQLIFTGIRPELALKAVDVRVDFSQLKTMGTVKQALKLYLMAN
ncbi:PAS sensor protein [Planococcus antarcticus DSM 14505]|uniref:Histidine kinase n=1 Tax=Planococcus antarcticus DSM 14505 TaxID=1185653 RepID=A0A1C7DDN0_9BACL|nr:PAS domain S-box protein [Planococcus antarcticus]ANU09554.1 histidine kinase [Planococcus antarcticus DSM 14505]EIM08245.1 PAS sensor protein [Planococcus antarcticus DSM 14505]